MNVLADDAVGFRGGASDVAGDLPVVMGDALGSETEGRGIVVAGLNLEA